jgi:L-glyceraldehyde 3-phosphate reductase
VEEIVPAAPTFDEHRYDSMIYRRSGRSGLKLPAISLGAWETFGGYRDADVARACLYRAFDLGITHFDLANNYGMPPGNAERVVGKILRDMPRDELIISTKAGWYMWPGPYGDLLSKKYLVASLDQSLKRLGLDYVDIYYAHRPDPDTPVEETMAALDLIVRQGKALYVGVSNFSGVDFVAAEMACERLHLAPITIHQPCYNMLERDIERDLFPQTARAGTGIIAYSPLASGLLTAKYLGDTIPGDSRAALMWGDQWVKDQLTAGQRAILQELNALAQQRGQTLAQMALAWILRLPAVTSALIGASSVAQVEENVRSLDQLAFSAEELQTIDRLTLGRPA